MQCAASFILYPEVGIRVYVDDMKLTQEEILLSWLKGRGTYIPCLKRRNAEKSKLELTVT